MTSYKCLKYNHPTKPKMLINTYGWYDLNHVWGKPRPEGLTSNQMVGQKCISFTWMYKQPIYFFSPQWVSAQIATRPPSNTYTEVHIVHPAYCHRVRGLKSHQHDTRMCRSGFERMMGTNYPLDHTTAQQAMVKVVEYQRL